MIAINVILFLIQIRLMTFMSFACLHHGKSGIRGNGMGMRGSLGSGRRGIRGLGNGRRGCGRGMRGIGMGDLGRGMRGGLIIMVLLLMSVKVKD